MRVKPLTAVCLVSVLATLACGGSMTVEVNDGSDMVSGLEVMYMPFDRDSVFDALAAQADSPEPTMAADLQERYDAALARQGEWRQAEQEWNDVREQMRQIQAELDGMNPSSTEYRQQFSELTNLEGREQALTVNRQRLFEEYTGMLEATQTSVDSFGAVYESWADRAFAGYFDLEAELLEATGREIIADTTGDAGTVTTGLSGGPWWVTATTSTVEGELYWNVKVEQVTGDTLRLTPDQAELRPHN